MDRARSNALASGDDKLFATFMGLPMTHTVSVARRRSMIRMVRERLAVAAVATGIVLCSVQFGLLAWLVADATYQVIAANF